jgi:hypothetical protein
MRPQLLWFLLLACRALAQITVEGDVVLKSTGQPLPGVRVVANCGGMQWTATDVAGHFRFPALPALSPDCYLSADGPRLLPRAQAIPRPPQAIRMVMRSQAVIAGKILDEKGWPLQGTTVTAAQYRTVNGLSALQSVATASANDLGEYRFGKLLAGRYYLFIRPPYPQPGGDYLATWYGAAAAENAQPIDLVEGRELSGIDVHLSRGGGAALRGRVIPPDGLKPQQTYLRVAWENLGVASGGALVPIAPDGTFEVRHVSPGRYILTAATSDPLDAGAMPAYLATQSVLVSRDDLDGLTLHIVPTPVRDLHGAIVCEGGCDLTKVHIGITRLLMRFSASAAVAADGSFVIHGVWPGRYLLQAFSPDGQLTSVRFGSQETLALYGQPSGEFDFDSNVEPVRVAFTRTVPLTGTLSDAAARPIAGARVLLLAPNAAAAFDPFLQAETNESGAFTLPHVLPGSYQVHVAEDALDLGLQPSPEFPAITVGASGNPPLTLRMPAR